MTVTGYVMSLYSFLQHPITFFFQTSDILYYEVLDIPLPELQGLKTLKVAFHHATKDEVSLLGFFFYFLFPPTLMCFLKIILVPFF